MIELYGLIGCPYSLKAVQLLEMNNINSKIIWINQEKKNEYKKKNKMKKFPQIFFKNKTKRTKIGGYDQLDILFSIINLITNSKFDINIINYLYKNYKK